jgi:8-oxo-dGTP diphosphatase
MGASVAAIVLRGGLVLVARRDMQGPMGGRWEFPGGKIEEGEGEGEAVEREFREEFDAEVRPIRRIGETSFSHRGIERSLFGWLAELAPEETLVLKEHLEYRWVELGDLEALDLADSDRKLIPFIEAYLRARK